MHEEYQDQNFLVLGVSVDRAKMQKIRDYVKRHEISFPNLLDKGLTTAQRYGVRGVPTTFIIDVKGRIRGIAVGLRQWSGNDAQNLVKILLKEIR